MERTRSGLVVSKARLRPVRKAGRPLKRSNGIDFRRTGIQEPLNRLLISLTAMTESNSPMQKIDKAASVSSPKSGGAIVTRRSLAVTANCFRALACWMSNVAAEFWSLAALDAGAARVVGVDSRLKPIETAKQTFGKYGVEPNSYEFIKAKVFAALRTLDPGAFDLILCQDSLSDLHCFFDEAQRLKPKHVILDTAISHRKPPVVVFKTTAFKLRDPKATAPEANPRRRIASIVALPNHAVISMLCEQFGFRCRFVDWQSLGITNWVGITDYENDRRRTYVLERLP